MSVTREKGGFNPLLRENELEKIRGGWWKRCSSGGGIVVVGGGGVERFLEDFLRPF